VTGGLERYNKIEEFSKRKAEEMDMELNDGLDSEYFRHIYKANDGTHTR
jgi:hypothetical protein